MIPILYEKTETSFTSNGIGRLTDCLSCTVTEERNGVYECEFTYPITGKHYEDITAGRIIAVTHDEQGDVQPFDIYAHTKPIDGIVTFYAHHISYRLGEITVKPFTTASIAATITKLNAASTFVNSCPFTFWTNKSVSGSYEVTVPKSARSLLCGEEGSLLDVFGTGEYDYDNFAVKLYLHRGSDSGVEIRYGKNLVDLTDETDYQDTYTAVVPYWSGTAADGDSEEEELVTLSEWAISSGHTSYNGRVVLVPMDLSGEFEEKPTESALRTLATSLLASGENWLPSQNIKVDFVALWQTAEYASYAPLQRVRLCDTVSVYYPELGIEAVEKKVVKTVYNTLLDRYDTIELGELQNSLVGVINSDIQDAIDALNASMENHNLTFQEVMEAAIENATELITGGQGGHVYLKPNANGEPEEILIMDSDDVNTAVKLWRWNLNGLGYSSTGYSGTYGTAITMDGAIVADYITTGTLNANIIRAGVLADVNGNTSFDLTTGELSMTTGSITLGNGTFSVDDTGAVVANSITLGNFQLTDETDGSYALQADYTDSGSVKWRTWIRTYVPGADHANETMALAVQALPSGGNQYQTGFAVQSDGMVYCNPLSSSGQASSTFFTVSTTQIGATNGYCSLDLGSATNGYYMTATSNYFWLYDASGNRMISCTQQNQAFFGFTNALLQIEYDDYAKLRGGNSALVLNGSSSAYLSFNNSTVLYANSSMTELSFNGSAFIAWESSGLFITTGRSTTAHSGNLYITGSGAAYYAKEGSSSRKIKTDIKPIEDDDLDPARLYDAEVIQYKYKDDFLSEDDPNRDRDLVGFIVEDLDEIYPVAVQKEDPDESETWTWSPYRIIPAMLKLIQDQHKEIESIKTKLN